MTLPFVHRQSLHILPARERVVARTFIPTDDARVANIVNRVLALPEEEVERTLSHVREKFDDRHRDLTSILRRHAALVAHHIAAAGRLSAARILLLGACFTMEYSFEGAALFNPSIVPHPEQEGAAEGELRVIVSLRATGEGHISSLEFREGAIAADGTLRLDSPSPFAELPRLVADCVLRFPRSASLSERLIFPLMADERNGIEDARWTPFVEPDGSACYYGTYVAYDGFHIRPKLLRTTNFREFAILPLRGPAVRNKGFALFPRRVRDQYVMLSRQDNEYNYIMFSRQLDTWDTMHLLRRPRESHELVQIGNNGPPIETARGWLVLTHGVGPMRQYTLGAELLDLDDPRRVVARLRSPLLGPSASEREGYVPNVVYTCGAVVHNGMLVIPYAMSDSACGVVSMTLHALLSAMEPEG